VKLLVSTPDLVVERLRGDIVSGRLAPGEPLRQDEIARSFGVSHVPIREAFLRLEAERLVEIRPRRGAIVAPLSAAELEELNEMRAALECCALRVAAPNLTDSDLQKAAQVLARIDRQPERWAEQNTAFHTILYKPSERPRLLAEILSLQRSVERYLYHEVKVTNNFAHSQREHRKLLELISQRKIEEACSLLNDHILKPGRILVSKLRKSGHA
jgi:DNA-binding GntR family transcriptional regulator